MAERFVSKCCKGERCWCWEPAEHKVEETIFPDDPHQHRHPFTAYLCHYHFCEIMHIPTCPNIPTPYKDLAGDKS